MQTGYGQIFKHICGFALILTAFAAHAESVTTDLLLDPQIQWRTDDSEQWLLEPGLIRGKTRVLDGEKTDPEASSFLVSSQVFGGDISVSLDVSFAAGRYLGVYLDFGQQSQSGIWMATGHALADDAPANEVERAYIKTVDDGFWIVRANGELIISGDERIALRFVRSGDDYRLFQDSQLIATYRKEGGYPPGPLQIRLTNAEATIHRLEVESAWMK